MSLALVTGATGVVGHYIVDALLAQGDQVRIVSRRPIDPWHSNLEVIRGDLQGSKVIDRLLEGTDALYHCAAEFYHQEKIWETNVHVTERLLEALPRHGVEYFCSMGSAGVLGASRNEWVDETTPCHPRDLYEKSKWEAEKIVLSSSLNIKVCVLRPVFVVSPERPGCVSYAIQNSWKDRLMVWVKGRERAHIVHAGDVAATAIHFRSHALSQPECFIVACDEDELNTLVGIYSCYHKPDIKDRKDVVLPSSLPLAIPHALRTLRRGPSLHGKVRFSSKKLRDHGFKLPYGFRGAIDDIRSHGNPL